MGRECRQARPPARRRALRHESRPRDLPGLSGPARRLQPFAHAVRRPISVRHVGGHRHSHPARRPAYLTPTGPTSVDPRQGRLRGRRTAMINDQTIPTKAEIAALAQWAEAGEFDPNFAGGKALHGAEAAAAGRALLEAAGVDVDAVERAVGGRPRLDPDRK